MTEDTRKEFEIHLKYTGKHPTSVNADKLQKCAEEAVNRIPDNEMETILVFRGKLDTNKMEFYLMFDLKSNSMGIS